MKATEKSAYKCRRKGSSINVDYKDNQEDDNKEDNEDDDDDDSKDMLPASCMSEELLRLHVEEARDELMTRNKVKPRLA
jgi:hypothetical protein